MKEIQLRDLLEKVIYDAYMCGTDTGISMDEQREKLISEITACFQVSS